VAHAVKQKYASTKSKMLVPVLNYSILMMHIYSTQSNGLPLISDVLMKAFIREPAIIGMKMLGRTSSLCQNLLVCMLCQKIFFKSKILHQMNIDKINKVIAKICCAPDTIACWESCHLSNQAWLSGDNLITQAKPF
jgi:hypothetical protein